MIAKLLSPFKSLAGQFTLLLILALMIANIITFLVLGMARDREFRKIERYSQIERLTTLMPALIALDPELRNDVAIAASNRRLSISLDKRPRVKKVSIDTEAILISEYIKDRLSFTGENTIRVGKRIRREAPPKNSNDIANRRQARGEITLISILMPDGTWLNARQQKLSGSPGRPALPIVLTLLLTFITVLAIGLWFIRKLTKPLRQLSQAANKAGRGDRTARIIETGATEIKDAASQYFI